MPNRRQSTLFTTSRLNLEDVRRRERDHVRDVNRFTSVVRPLLLRRHRSSFTSIEVRMWCSNCAIEVAEQKKFCGQCGSAVVQRCPACAAANPASSKFCGECGTKLRADPSAAVARDSRPIERRQLTVLFCDLVGSTALSARLDPEDFSAIIADYRRCISETVARLDGFVARHHGDGAVVFFGYPQAHEDDAERAVQASLALVQAVSALPAKEKLC